MLHNSFESNLAEEIRLPKALMGSLGFIEEIYKFYANFQIVSFNIPAKPGIKKNSTIQSGHWHLSVDAKINKDKSE